VKRGRWFRPGPDHQGSQPRPGPGVAPVADAARRPPRPRTGDPRADQLFGTLLTRRADRLLDELLRCGRVTQTTLRMG
jgi:hypothetical protein